MQQSQNNLFSRTFTSDLSSSPIIRKRMLGERILEAIEDFGFIITDIDFERSWGGFFRIDDSQAELFANFFLQKTRYKKILSQPFSPKILLIAPNKSLSLQKHMRRAEFIKILHGPIKIFSDDLKKTRKPLDIFQKNDSIYIPSKTPHRITGDLFSWGIIAEAWIHTDRGLKSDVDDVVVIRR